MLQALRMISLHPVRPTQNDTEDYQTASARFIQTITILDSIHQKKEKVLVFLESREHQPVLADLLRARYSLPRLPMIINGQTPTASRQKYVQTFQNERDRFDIMILSPKAAGVGLTLTAANHVIHLSRWWNPAVEDQCTDRIYRLGQERNVHVYYPLAIHSQPHLRDYSFDLQLHQLLERKRTLSRDVLMPPQTGNEAAELYSLVNAMPTKPTA
jgi:SNF2 family DNA or RNA helicase